MKYWDEIKENGRLITNDEIDKYMRHGHNSNNLLIYYTIT